MISTRQSILAAESYLWKTHGFKYFDKPPLPCIKPKDFDYYLEMMNKMANDDRLKEWRIRFNSRKKQIIKMAFEKVDAE